MTKLQHYVISDNLFLWLRAFLSNRSQTVKMNGKLSVNGDVTSGLPQENMLWPTIFFIYTNDVVDEFTDNSVKFKLFADIILYSSSPHNSSLQTADTQVVVLEWQLQLAHDKCLSSFHQEGSEQRPNKQLCNCLPNHIFHKTYPRLWSSLIIIDLLLKSTSIASFTRLLWNYSLNTFAQETKKF